MAYLSSQGHEVRGLDISKSVSDVILRRYGLTVEIEDLMAFSLRESGSWDAVIMRHVLEHFESPIAALRCASKLLRLGGRLYVAVPNMDSWHRKWSGWSGYESYHLHFFGQSLLRKGLDFARLGAGILTTPFRLVQVASGRGEELFALAIKGAE